MNTLPRCKWAQNASPEEIYYHDHEWGRPHYDNQHLFEMLTLEGAQAGLSWATVLKKRPNYRQAFDRFNIHQIAQYDQHKIDSLLANPGIIRNKLKIHSTITNAKACIELLEAGSSLSEFVWQFVDGKPVKNQWAAFEEVPVNTPVSDAMSQALKAKGFKFVGTTICYAYMQAVGMVNDHTLDCYCHPICENLADSD